MNVSIRITALVLLIIGSVFIGTPWAGAEELSNAPSDSPEAEGGSIYEVFSQIADQTPEFGGLYYEGDTLIINLTEESPDILQSVRTGIETYYGDVLYGKESETRIVKYGFNELRGWYQSIRDTIFSIDGVTGSDIDEKNNRIVVAVENESDSSTVQSQLARFGIPPDALVTQVTGGPVILDTPSQVNSEPQSTDDMYGRIADQVPEFGGFYYIGDVLHVNMTRQSPDLQEAVITTIGNEYAAVRDSRPEIVFDTVRYGFNELNTWYTNSRDTIYSYPFITVTGIDKKNNYIEIGLESSEDIPILEQALVATGIPRDALSITVQERFVTESSVKSSSIPLLGLLAVIGAVVLVLVWRYVLRRN